MTGLVIVVGAGPGVGGAVGRRWGAEGYAVGLIGQAGPKLDELGAQFQADGITTGWTGADLNDPESVTAAVQRLSADAGRIDVLHFNPSAYREADLRELSVPDLLEDVAFGVGALLTAVQAALPLMSRGGRITATGSMAADEPTPEAATLGIQKAGMRTLVTALDGALREDGIRATSVTVRGALKHDDPDSPFHPSKVADALYAAAHQDEGSWQTEVRYSG